MITHQSSCSYVDIVTGETPGIDALPDLEEDEEVDLSGYNFVPSVSDGVIHGTANLSKMKAILAAASSSGIAYNSYKDFTNYSYSKSTYTDYIGNIPTYIARDSGTAGSTDEAGNTYPETFSSNSTTVTRHFDAAYMSALQYALGVDDAEDHAYKALDILYQYSQSVTVLYNTGNAPLMCGQGYHAAAALALLDGYSGLTDEKKASIVDNLLVGCFIPVLDWYFDKEIDGAYTNGNWGLCACLTYLAIAVVAEDPEMYSFAVNEFLNGNGNGTIYHYFDAETGQCQETGRDQGHVQFGLSCAALFCEVAYNQGHDEMYLENDEVLLKGFEYTAQVLLGLDVEYKVYQDYTAAKKYSNWTSISSQEDEVGGYSACWSVVYNHFVNRLGKEMPYTNLLFETNGWPSEYNSNGLWYDMFTFAPHQNDQL